VESHLINLFNYNLIRRDGSLTKEEALFRVNRWMAYLLDYGILIHIDVFSNPIDHVLLQVACATDMSLFGYDQGVFSEY
jgi:hypothetical protein